MADSDTSLHKQAAVFLENWCKRFPRAERELAKVIKSREKDFLGLGESIQSVAMNAQDLSQEAAFLAETAAGNEVQDLTSQLHAELQEMQSHCSLATSSENIEEMQSIGNASMALDEQVSDFKRIFRALQMLGISTRIESARLGSKGRGFSTLADDVEKLANAIVEYSTEILGKSKMLNDVVDTAKKQTTQMIVHQQECSSSSLGVINADLDALTAMAGRAGSASTELTQYTGVMMESVGEIVSSMQFHDITRQQVEHVEEAMQDMTAVGSGKNGDDPLASEDRIRDVVGWMGDVCTLQISQLNNASERFVQAVERLKENLYGVSENVASAASIVRGVLGNESDTSVLTHVESGIVNVALTMKDFAEQGAQMGRMMTNVVRIVSEMDEFVGKIEDLGAEIELIALNASIKAAHTGEEGKALGVLALSIQRLSLDARLQTEAIAKILNGISESAAVLEANASSYQDTSMVDAQVGRLQDVTAKLRVTDKSLSGVMNRLTENCTLLGQQIEKIISGISFHHDVAAGLDVARVHVQECAAQALDIVPHSEDTNRPERLKEMLARYTMEVERLVHEEAFEGESGKSQKTTTWSDDSVDLWGDDEDLDSNVELF